MNMTQALNYIHANIAEIGAEALMNNRLAGEVVAAYARFVQNPNEYTKQSLVKSADAWQQFKLEAQA